MQEKFITVRLLDIVKSEADRKAQPVERWFKDQVALSTGIAQGLIFQKIGDEYLKLNMRDIRPYNEEIGKIKPGETYRAISVSENAVREALKLIGTPNEDMKTWVLRVINLGIIAPNMDLYFLDGSEYNQIVFVPEEEGIIGCNGCL